MTHDTAVIRDTTAPLDPEPGRRPHEELLSLADLLTPNVIRAAATLGVADHIAAGAITAAAVAERAGTQPDVTRALLDHLADIGLLTTTESGGGPADGERVYALTAVGEPLRTDDPSSVRRLLRNDGVLGRSALSLIHLDHTLRTGEPAHAADPAGGYWEIVNHGAEFVDEWAEHADIADRLQDLPLPWDAGIIVDSYDWGPVHHVVDVGGHMGVVTVALLRRHRHLRATLVDLYNAAEQAARRFARSDVAERAEAVVGSFFEPLPRGADVYLLSAILADWSDGDAARILRRCAEAAGPHGRILLAEVTMPAGGPALELQYRSMMPAPARSVAELEAIAAEAGLAVTWRGPVTAVRTVLELAPILAAAAPEEDRHDG